jgi:hypothetical protein
MKLSEIVILLIGPTLDDDTVSDDDVLPPINQPKHDEISLSEDEISSSDDDHEDSFG